jgi:hypothetical protein
MNILELSDFYTDFVLGLIKPLPVKIKHSHNREHKTLATRNCNTDTVVAQRANTHSHLLEKYTMFQKYVDTSILITDLFHFQTHWTLYELPPLFNDFSFGNTPGIGQS